MERDSRVQLKKYMWRNNYWNTKSPFDVADPPETLVDVFPEVVESDDELFEFDPNILNRPKPPEPPSPEPDPPPSPNPETSDCESGGGSSERVKKI